MKDINQEITQRFIDTLESGVIPWQVPWKSAQNLITRKPYRGINVFLLAMRSDSSPFWLSFKQAVELGGNVRKGERGTMIVYYKLLAKVNEHGQPVTNEHGRQKMLPFLRYSHVFNLDQCEGLQAPQDTTATASGFGAIDLAQELVQLSPAPIKTEGSQPCYVPSADEIRMPSKEAFFRLESYYHTLFHEMTHATGHTSRLAREEVCDVVKFGSESYSKEELTAELGASFLSNHAQILDNVEFNNSAAYLASWLRRLKSDKNFILSAASRAQHATDYIMSKTHQEEIA